jgi:hypothetical protein
VHFVIHFRAVKSVLRQEYKTVHNILSTTSRRLWQGAHPAAQLAGMSALPAWRSRDPATGAGKRFKIAIDSSRKGVIEKCWQKIVCL